MSRGKQAISVVVAAIAACAIAAAGARATPVAVTLTASNGEGTFDATLPCPGGDGPSWRYGWTGVATGGPLAGSWTGTAEVHDAGAAAFIPHGTGRLAIAMTRGGTAFLDFGSGGCASTPLSLVTQPDGDPQAKGTLPLVAILGTGAARGLTGTGTAKVDLELGPGADNQATITVAGNFAVKAPELTIGSATARWRNLSDWLKKRLTVFVTVANASGAGNAYDARLTGATGGAYCCTPTPLGTIAAGATSTAALVLSGASPNSTQTIVATADSQDGLGGPVAPITGAASFKAPLLP